MITVECNRAYYTASRKRKFVTIKHPTLNTEIVELDVSGKVEARKIAKEHNAKCWNF